MDTTRISETVLHSKNPSRPESMPATSVVPSLPASAVPGAPLPKAAAVQERADSEPPQAKRLRRAGDEPAALGLARAASDIGPPPTPRPMPPPTAPSASFVTARGYTQDSLEIRPPSPPSAQQTLKPEDLVTFGLQRLASQLSIPKRYRPASQTRALDPFERGYWVVNCADWPDELKAYAWLEMANYVGGGTAGWGVACVRNQEFSELRVYCWGHIVAYIYLLLYLNSRRRLLTTEGVCWIDGESKVVIAMGIKRG